MSNKDLWISILKRIQPTIKKAHFLTWFQSTAVLGVEGGIVKVGVPSSFAEMYMQSKYHVKILQAAQEIDKSYQEVVFEVKTGLKDDKHSEAVDVKALFADEFEKKVRKVRNENAINIVSGRSGKIYSDMLNERYRLDNFVIGQENSLPHAACTAVTKMPGGIYNPLYIYGGTGMGKTHLLQAVGNQILKDDPEKVVKYVTAEQFVTEVVDAIGKRYMKIFKDRYRKVDCLIVDDVQFFARKESSQQEFFYTFNQLYNNNKQVIISSDRSPSELDGLDARIKSRFGMGMVVELLFPDFETRLAILHQKCQEFQIMIDPDVLSFIASNVHNSVRELEGILRQAVAEAELTNRIPTIRSVAEIIKRMNKAQKIIGFDIEAKSRAYATSNEDVIRAVAEYYNLTTDELIGADRHKEIAMPRQICMYLIKNELGSSYEKIGDEFGGRNHTTVMHACNKMSQQLRKDLRLIKDINSIKRGIGL